VLAPAKTPKEVIGCFNAAIVAAMNEPRGACPLGPVRCVTCRVFGRPSSVNILKDEFIAGAGITHEEKHQGE